MMDWMGAGKAEGYSNRVLFSGDHRSSKVIIEVVFVQYGRLE